MTEFGASKILRIFEVPSSAIQGIFGIFEIFSKIFKF